MVNGSKIVFKDFTGEVNEQILNIIDNWLDESGYLLVDEIQNRAGSGTYYNEIAGKWEHKVDRQKHETIVGNPLENALWVEFGTGEYALKGDGRKGYWVFVKDSTGKSSKSTKQYTLQEAKQTVAFMRSKGLDAMYTKGTPPKRPMHHAFISNEEPIKDALREKLRGMKSGK